MNVFVRSHQIGVWKPMNFEKKTLKSHNHVHLKRQFKWISFPKHSREHLNNLFHFKWICCLSMITISLNILFGFFFGSAVICAFSPSKVSERKLLIYIRICVSHFKFSAAKSIRFHTSLISCPFRTNVYSYFKIENKLVCILSWNAFVFLFF